MERIKTSVTASNKLKARLWTSRIMGGLVIAFMLIDSIPKILVNESTTQGMLAFGFQAHHISIIGILGFISALLFAIPRTQILGTVLLTGYLGGAIATHVRLDHSLFSLVLFPVYLALLAWGSTLLKNECLRKLLLNKG